MKEYLVDVPVKINIWIRKECLRKQFEVIRQARPKVLFIQSDGGRNDYEWEIINYNRKMIDDGIDWKCNVFRIYEDKNLGLYAMWRKSYELVWTNVDRCIFLEDDDVPAVSFFRFCKELLDLYENDYRIQGICGYNPLGVYNEVSSDYFFTGEFNQWGIATWKRSVSLINDNNFRYINDDYVKKLMKLHLGNYVYNRAIKCAKEGKIDGHVPGSEFFRGLSRATQNALYIFPKRNMISNHGCGDDSVHSSDYLTLSREEQALFYSKVYEIDRDIIHPDYVIRDILFEEMARKCSGFGHPITRCKRRLIKFFKILRFQGVQGIKKKIRKIIINRNEK